MPKGPVERGSTELLQNHVNETAETTLEKTFLDTNNRGKRNLQVKQEMAVELAAMGFPKRTVERLLNMRMKEGTLKGKTKKENRQEA